MSEFIKNVILSEEAFCADDGYKTVGLFNATETEKKIRLKARTQVFSAKESTRTSGREKRFVRTGFRRFFPRTEARFSR